MFEGEDKGGKEGGASVLFAVAVSLESGCNSVIVEEMKWMDRSIREAIVLVSDGRYSVVCFSHPCNYSVGEQVEDLLCCLNAQDVELADQDRYLASHDDWEFPHRICGRLSDSSRGIVCVGELQLQIDAGVIPGDIKSGQFIQFSTSRIDLY